MVSCCWLLVCLAGGSATASRPTIQLRGTWSLSREKYRDVAPPTLVAPWALFPVLSTSNSAGMTGTDEAGGVSRSRQAPNYAWFPSLPKAIDHSMGAHFCFGARAWRNRNVYRHGRVAVACRLYAIDHMK